jgi:hypothetical protein
LSYQDWNQSFEAIRGSRRTSRFARFSRVALVASVLGGAVSVVYPPLAVAQAAPASRVQGTVKSISGNTIVVTTATGDSTVTVADGARVQQSADMKTVSPSSLDQIAVGDRVLAMGTPGSGTDFTANRVILIKSEAIAQRNQNTQADWNRRGSGGIVKSIDASAKTVTISSGARTVVINTTGTTIFRRYAPGSVKFEDAKPGTLAELQPGDQLRVRGDKSADGTSVAAEEIVSGSFKNLSGTIVSVNASANSLVIKDLATKKNETVVIGESSDVRSLPPEMATRLAAAHRGAAAGPASGAPAGGRPAGAAAASAAPAGGGASSGDTAEGRRPGGGRAGGASGDLSQMIPRLPKAAVTDLKPGEALMIVASGSGGPYTAITVLSGVEPLLTGPAGSEMSISPWSLGSGGGEGGGGAAE